MAALHIACIKENVEIVKLLLAHNQINVNLKCIAEGVKKTALHIACEKGNVEIVKLLLAHQTIDVNVQIEKKALSALKIVINTLDPGGKMDNKRSTSRNSSAYCMF